MAGGGLGVGVLVVGSDIVDPVLEQVAKPTLPEPVSEAPQRVAAELIDRDLENQVDLFTGGSVSGTGLSGSDNPAQQQGKNSGSHHDS